MDLSTQQAVQRTIALRAIATCSVGAVLYFARVAFEPIALALLCALVLSGPVEALQRFHIPRGLSAGIILMIVLALALGLAEFLWIPAQHWLDRAPSDVETIKDKLSPITHFVSHVQDLKSSAQSIDRAVAPSLAISSTVADASPITLFEATRAAAISTLAFIVVTLFLLIGGPPMLANMAAALTSDLKSAHIIDVLEKVRLEVGRFYVTVALMNIVFGCVTAAAMALCGMPNPVLWGAVAGVLNFIPYAGSATTLVLLGLVALVSFDNLDRVFAVVASYLILTATVGQFVQPLLVGRRLQVNPLLIFLSLWFCGVFWGLAGIILSTPILVACKVIAEHAYHGEAAVKFLSPPPLSSAFLAKLRRT